MRRYQARSKARALWYRRSNAVSATIGDRRGTALARHRKIAERFEVGYIELVSVVPERWAATTCGRGASWEEAFESAGAAIS